MKQAVEFRTAYGVTNNITHEMMQLRLIEEEFEEFRNAAEFERDEDCLKELADLVYVCAQYAANLGWDLDEALARVHASNLSKTRFKMVNLSVVLTVKYLKDQTINLLI